MLECQDCNFSEPPRQTFLDEYRWWPSLFVGLTSKEYPINIKTANNKEPPFFCFLSPFGIKREKSSDNRGQCPRKISFEANSDTRIVKTENNKHADNECRLYVKFSDLIQDSGVVIRRIGYGHVLSGLDVELLQLSLQLGHVRDRDGNVGHNLNGEKGLC
jgi:hypothetical protein